MMFMAEEATTGAKKDAAPAPQAVQQATDDKAKKKPAKRRLSRSRANVVSVKAKRKESRARAHVRAGSGIIRINKRSIASVEAGPIRDLMLEPLMISPIARDMATKVDIKINVYGGGLTSQTQAVRGAIAKGLVAFSGNETLKKEFLAYDRALLVDDPRRVEPKKFKGPKARARFQTSYR